MGALFEKKDADFLFINLKYLEIYVLIFTTHCL